jgi:adenosine kinase
MKIILTGSVAFDYLMRFPGYFKDHILADHLDSISLSFLVESMTRQRGGIAANIAYTLALLGEHPSLWATVGQDFGEYRQWLESQGVDTTWARVIPDVYTASFFANTDRSNAQIASFYPGAMGYAASLSLKELVDTPPDLVMISPNDPEAMKQYVRECQDFHFPFIYDPSQQIVRLCAEDLMCGVDGARAIFVNDYEFALLQNMTHFSIEDILARMENHPRAFLVVTRGENGADIYTRFGAMNTPIVPPECIQDPTGVGDAFRGGFLTAYIEGLDWEICGRMGALAATYCLEQSGPQGQAYTRTEFVARYRRHFDDGGILDRFIQR